MDYCKTTFPSYLKAFKIDFEDNNDGNCKYAFVVEKKQFKKLSYDMGIEPCSRDFELEWDLDLAL